jgi:hypothetical protein
MRKSVYFDAFDGPGWPSPSQLLPYFLGPRERRRIFARRNGCWGLSAEGVDGTAHLPRNKGRIDLNLTILGNFNHGILLHYHKTGGARGEFYYSKGDLSRLKEWVKTMHGDLMPVGLYIPFESAWKAVKEFMERDGALPNSIEWIAGEDIPDDAFPDPYLYRLAQS